jgi:hypothetical protein
MAIALFALAGAHQKLQRDYTYTAIAYLIYKYTSMPPSGFSM